jgi:adenosylhomocysteine nucleosidase
MAKTTDTPVGDFDLPEIEPNPEDGIDRPIGILSAVPEEEEAFKPFFSEIESGERMGFTVRHGVMEGKPVVLMRSGVGKVNAAIGTMALIQEFYCGTIVMAGVAGSLDPAIGIGDVVVAKRVVQHDYGSIIDGHIKTYQPGVLPLPGYEGKIGYDLDNRLHEHVKRALKGLDLPPLSRELTGGEYRLPKAHFGTIVSGDQFVNCARTRERLAFEFGAMAVEMEGAAIAQVCERFNVPCLIVRGISDLAGSQSHYNFPAFAHDVSVAVASVVRRLIAVI